MWLRLTLQRAAAGGLCAYGTVLEIVQHQVFGDGRLVVMCQGRERYRIEDIVEEKPVLRARVSFLPVRAARNAAVLMHCTVDSIAEV